MPDFDQKDLMPWHSVSVHLRDSSARRAFSEAIGQKLTDKTQFVWHPRAEIADNRKRAFVGATQVGPRFPVYIISKGRWESRLTAKALAEIGVSFRIVVEPQELEQYAAVIPRENVLVLPFSNLGLGSIPARNWVWDHAQASGAERHWILDDNIGGFMRLCNNEKIAVRGGQTFYAIEEFCERYENVALAGMNYHFFAKRKQKIPPFYLNTRIYSCILISHKLDMRWRGRYNEDTDLSLRALKAGWCTVLFNAFLCEKAATMSMKGGNTDQLYAGDGRLKMAQSLAEQHPDVVRVTEKWGRAQHHVDYSPFAGNRLVPKSGMIAESSSNNFGMAIDCRK
jgi:hypothetical protein